MNFFKEQNVSKYFKTTEDSNNRFTIKSYSTINYDTTEATLAEIIETNGNIYRKEKEDTFKELKKTIDEIESLSVHFDKKYFSEKTLLRENELRIHLKNLQERFNIRDVETIRVSIQNLYESIITNVMIIYDEMKAELLNKKKDVEIKIEIRLSNAQENHRRILDEKTLEQELMLRNSNNINSEMIKIKENYEKIKNRNETFYSSNVDLQKKINDEMQRNKCYKVQMKQIKICLKDNHSKLMETIASKTVSNSFPKSEMISGKKENNTKSKFGFGYSKINSTMTIKSNQTENSIYPTLGINSIENKGTITTSNGRNNLTKNKSFYKSIKTKMFKIEKEECIAKIISIKTPDILKHTLGLLKTKINTFKKEYNYNTSNNSNLNYRVYELMRKVKKDATRVKDLNMGSTFYTTNSNINNKLKFLLACETKNRIFSTDRPPVTLDLINSSKNISVGSSKEQFLTFKYEERKRFIDVLVNDKNIQALIADEKFPKINVAHRTVNFQSI